MMITRIAFVLALAAVPTFSYSSYQLAVPNGNNMNHPCKVNYRWPGLGHQNPLGGGARNAFGEDFARLGNTWNDALCRFDSDGDGLTNGQELGDPNCVWRPGQVPRNTQNISHPGVCEPVDSPRCQGRVDFVNCELERFQDCAAINFPKVRNMDVRFSPIKVPNTETNYFCINFRLPHDQDYHLVAYEPIIDNANVLHHILMYGCKDPNGPMLSEPQLCGMTAGDNDCQEIIGLWTVGSPGFCFPLNLGFRFGASGYSRVRLEAHYNNPQFRNDWTDQSGLKLYYQPAEPQFQDLYTLMLGQIVLEIPPGKARVTQKAVCKDTCTSMFLTKEAYIFSAINHMHYLGRAANIELFRNGRLLKNLSNEEYYSYDNPIEHVHSPPIRLLPGDELRTTCVFSSISSNRWTYYGEGTNDEMCFGFLTIYPRDALAEGASCVSFGPMDACDLYSGTPVSSCNWSKFLNFTGPDMKQSWDAVKKDCNDNGFCRPECRQSAERVLSHQCMKSDMRHTVNWLMRQSHEGQTMLAKLTSCEHTGSSTGVCSADQCRDVCDSDYADVRDSAATTLAGIVSTLCIVVSAVFVGRF